MPATLNKNRHPLARARRARGLSQVALARELGISQEALSAYELEEKRPRPLRAAKIARYFGEDILTLFPRYFG